MGKWCKVLFICVLMAGVAKVSNAQHDLKALDRVRPMSWWVDMADSSLQLLVHGKNIADRTVTLDYPGVHLIKVNKVENPNYLFIDLVIDKGTRSGSFDLEFSKQGTKTIVYNYKLDQPDQRPGRNQGVTSEDLIYLVMPDRFSNGDPSNDRIAGMKDQSLNRDSMYDRHGGDLLGLMNHLDYIKDLGATAIWCTPMIENDMSSASYHGYAATDIYKIDPRFGSNELYKAFVEKAHKMGLKVIKDVVHNHIGSQGWIMQDLPMKDWVHQWPTYTNSSYRDQPVMDIHRSVADQKIMLNGWFVPTMPDLNQNNPYVDRYLTQNHIWWIEYAGIDGLRLDTYPYNDPKFMSVWARAILNQFPHLSIFGETLVTTAAEQAFFAGGNTVNRGLDTHLPGVTDAVLKDAIYGFLNDKEGWVDGSNKLYATLSLDFLYKHPEQNVVFLDNHDMSRFYSMIGEDFNKFRQGMGILLTMRGIPQLYYGTEILMKNFSNPDGLVREDFPGGWNQDTVSKFTAKGRSEKENNAFNFIRTLARFRASSPALRAGKLMQYVPEDKIYTYFRYTDTQSVMVIVNKNDQMKNLNTNRFKESLQGYKQATNVITGSRLPDITSLSLPANSITILQLQK